MQRALTSGCHEDDLPPPHDPNHLAPPNHSWLSRLSSNHRRGSMGFSEIGGTSMIDDENSNSFQGKSNSNSMTYSLDKLKPKPKTKNQIFLLLTFQLC